MRHLQSSRAGPSKSSSTSPSSSFSSRHSLSPFDDANNTMESQRSRSSTVSELSSNVFEDMDIDNLPPHSESLLLSPEILKKRNPRKRSTVQPSQIKTRSATAAASSKRLPTGDSPQEKVRRHTSQRAFQQAATSARSDRTARVRDLKDRALRIPSTGKVPASTRQRLVMQMVYDQITPYPDEAWLAQIGVIINREYHQVKNWFSNQRQKDARDVRKTTSKTSPSASPKSALRKITCDSRELSLRTSVLEHCDEDQWSDAFFQEVLMIYNFRLLARESQEMAKAPRSESPADS